MANLKGNLGVKSSPLAPTACKLSTQYLVLDHMTNHYNKISKAKSAIDNKPPKSLSTSQKLRDRKTRQRVTSPQRTRPLSANAQTYEHGDLEDYQDLLNEEPEDEEERLAYSIMRSTLGKQASDSHKATYNSEYPSQGRSAVSDHPANHYEQTNNFTKTNQTLYERPLSARSGRSIRSYASTQRGTRIPINHVDPTKVTYNGDVIEKRAHCFTEPERPFTPRTLKTNHQSRLKSSKCYNPPRLTKSSQNGAIQSASQSYVSEETSMSRVQPRPQPRQRVRSAQSEDLGETLPTSQLSESMLMDITLQSRDGGRAQNQKGQVPPLAISMDVDHLNWLQEQASKAQVRARHSGKFKNPLEAQTNNDRQNGTHDDTNGLSNSVRLETLKKEEEQKYLTFAKEVTDDVLATGISSDRVLNKLFESHIERRRGELDEDRMREVVKDLKINLGLKEQPPVITEYKKRSSSRNSNDGASGRSTPKAPSGRTTPKAQSGRSTPKAQSGRSTPKAQSGRSTPKAQSGRSTPKAQSGRSTPKAQSRHSADNLSETSSIKERHAMMSEFNNTLTVNGNETLDSTSTMKFGQTGDMFSTIHTEGFGDNEADLSEGELATTSKENGDDLTATQALKQYQMTLTAKEASGDINGEMSESDIYRDVGETLDPSGSSDRPATGEMRTMQERDGDELSTTGQITIETGNSLNNGADMSPAPSSEITPGSVTQNSELSPEYSNNSQESNSYGHLMPKTKPRARRRMKGNNSSSSEANGSTNVTNGGNGTMHGLSTMSTESWSEKESENGDEGQKRSRLRKVAEEIDKVSLSETVDDKNAQNDTGEDVKADEEYASDYEEEDTHRTSDDDF